MLWLLFFCCGATAMIYAVTWSRYLALLLGDTNQAHTVVLAVFLGGLALGARLFGGRADRARQPLAWHGYLEVGIGLYAFFFEMFFRIAEKVFESAGVMVLGHGVLLLLLKGSVSAGLLLGPAVLMGGRLPALAGWWQRHASDAGRRVARLYALKAAGAGCGAWLAGFFLVEWIGLAATSQMTALLNVLIGFAAIGLARSVQEVPAAAERVLPDVPREREAESDVALAWACGLVAVIGGTLMGLEVLASRALSLVFGASSQVVSLGPMAFMFGLAAVSMVVTSPRWRNFKRERLTHLLLIAAACLIGLLLSHLEQFVELYQALRAGLARSEMGYRFHQLLVGGISLIFLGMPAGLLGAVLPLWLRAEAGSGIKLGRNVGRLFAWQMIGAVVGLLLTDFLLMPGIGLRASLGVLAILLCLAATPTAFIIGRPRPILAATAVVALLVVASQTGGDGWRHVMSSGLFRAREGEAKPLLLPERVEHIRLLFYKDAPDATVSAEVGDGVHAAAEVTLRSNGHVKARSRGDLATQYLLAHLPMLARPESEEVFVLGLGSGITAGALLGHPVKRVEVAERSAPAVQASRFFEPLCRGVLTNSLVKLWPEDGRTVLRLSPHRYDLIISHPPHPWLAGAGALFSREFFELAASRLQEGGLMAQWFHVDETSDGILLMVFRTFARVFPFLEVWDAGGGDLILLGSRRSWPTGANAYAQVVEREWPRHDLERIGLKSPAMLWARQLASQQTAFAIAGEVGAIQSDGFPVLEYAAPPAFYLGGVARALFKFDERTWQSALASPDKRVALATLDRSALATIFAEFGTVNADLDRYLHQRLRLGVETESVGVAVGGFYMPCVFQPAGTWPQMPPPTTGAEQTWLKLLRAEASLHTEPEAWQAAVETILSTLRANQLKPGLQDPAGASAHFAAVAVRACLSRGELERAAQLLELALGSDPNGLELGYLKRLWERQSAIRAAAGVAGN